MRLLLAANLPSFFRDFLVPYARHFRSKGWRVDAMTGRVPDSRQTTLDAFDRTWEIDWSRRPARLQNLFTAPRQIRDIVLREQYDIVHVHTPVPAFVTRFALRGARRAGRPMIIYTAHGFRFHRNGSVLGNALPLLLEKLAGAWTDYLVVINREDEEWAKKHRLVPEDRVVYMPGIGVDTGWFKPEAVPGSEVLRVRSELGLTPDDQLLLMVAQFVPRKRHADALRAFACLRRPGVCLAFAGTGPLLGRMKALAKRLGIEKRVRFLGYRSDMRELVRASVATLLPSEREGLARCVIESMSLEVPVIGAKARGIADLLDEGAGLLVPVGDVNALSEAMGWILDNPPERLSLGRKSRERVMQCGVRDIIKLHETLYDSVRSPQRCRKCKRT